jgi:glycosyltransferase involved in cell wall biosynthesis
MPVKGPQNGDDGSRVASGAVDANPYLLVLKNGPVHSLEDRIEYWLDTVSASFKGELWATGSFAAFKTIGGFQVNIRKVPEPTSRWVQLAYAITIFRRALSLRRTHKGRCLVLTYDPFRNGLMGAIVASLLRAPLVVEVNGCYGDVEAFLDGGNSMAEASKKRRHMLAVGRYVLRRASAIRVLFPEQLKGFVDDTGQIPIRRGFDLIPIDRFRNIANEKFVLFVGYPFFLKGVDILVSAYLSIADQCPGWRLVLVGHELAGEVAKMTSDQRVEVHRAVSNVAVAEWIGRCSIFVLPSRTEAMGRVLLEAAAAGKPRVAARVGGTYTVVNDGVDGLLVEPRSVAALASALLRLVHDKPWRDALGAAARRRAETEFTAKVHLEKFQDLINAANTAQRK